MNGEQLSEEERAAVAPDLAKAARPVIVVRLGDEPWTVDQAEEILVKKAPELSIFQRGNFIVRVIALAVKKDTPGGLRRPAGTVQLEPMSREYLEDVFGSIIAWRKEMKRDQPDVPKVRTIACPAFVPKIYSSRVGRWSLPVLEGFIETPVMRRDGTILSAPGYDEETGLYLKIGGDWPRVPSAPTKADAEAAMKVLREPFAQFPFVSAADESVFIAGILTALQRRLLTFAPIFGFSAPAPRSGKSLLAESIAMIALGRTAPAFSVAKDRNEFRKAITATLYEGHAITNLDNVDAPLGSPDLCKALTQLIYGDRLLGATRNLSLLTNILWTATGNNLTFKSDLSSRALRCQIDAETERPEERTFKIPDLLAYLLENRRRLVTAALTIQRAYWIAGRPRQNVKPWGGFDDWSRNIREPLIWLGMDDPCKTREKIIVADPERESNVSAGLAWYKAFANKGMRTAEVITAASDNNNNNQELREALLAVACDWKSRSQISPDRLGMWCRSVEGRIFEGLRFSREASRDRAVIWSVTKKDGDKKKKPDDAVPPEVPRKRKFQG